MKAAVLTEYKKFDWKELPTPVAQTGEVLVKVKYASICGSDQHIFVGEFHPRTQLPLVPGHEFMGEIAEVGEGVGQWKIGNRVVVDPIIWCGQCPACQRGHYPACTSLKLIGIDMDGGFGEYVAVPEHTLYKIGEAVPDRLAALVEVLSIGFHASNRSGIQEGDSVAIWGAGKVGQSVLQAAQTLTNGPIFIVDILEERLDIARKAFPGVVAIQASKENPVEKIKQETHGKGVDIAIEAVGHSQEIPNVPHPVRACVQSIRGAGKVCVLGLADDPAPVVMKELIWKEGTIVASRVSHGEFKDSLQALESHKLTADALISAEFHMSEAQKAFELLENNPRDYLKILLYF